MKGILAHACQDKLLFTFSLEDICSTQFVFPGVEFYTGFTEVHYPLFIYIAE